MKQWKLYQIVDVIYIVNIMRQSFEINKKKKKDENRKLIEKLDVQSQDFEGIL